MTIDTAIKWVAIIILGGALAFVFISAAIEEPVGAILWVGIFAGVSYLIRRRRIKPEVEDEPESV